MNYIFPIFAVMGFVAMVQPGAAHEPKKLTSLASNVLISRITTLSVDIYDGVTDGCMKWPTGVSQTASEKLQETGKFDSESPKALQIIASGYLHQGTNICFVNIDLLVDDLSDVYFDVGPDTYSAFSRIEIWKTSFMISDIRENMQNNIQNRVASSVEELIFDIERSEDIVRQNDPDYFENYIMFFRD